MWTTELSIGPYGIAPALSPLWYLSALGAFTGLAAAVWRGRYPYAAGYAVLLTMFITLQSFLLEKAIRLPYVFNSYRYATSATSPTSRKPTGASVPRRQAWRLRKRQSTGTSETGQA